MPDFDTNVALQARGYNPQDAVAPLQAYMLAQQGRNLETENQLAQLKLQQGQAGFNALQHYTDAMKAPGADPTTAANASGLNINPEAMKETLGNIQSLNTLGALKSYAQNPSNPGSLALAGPSAVGEASTALGTQALTQGTEQDTEAKRANLRGQIAMGYLQNPTDLGWKQAAGQAHASGLVSGLQAWHALENITDPGERLAIAKQWAAAGAGSVQSSGVAAGNIAQAETVNRLHDVVPGHGLWGSPQLQRAIDSGQTPVARAPVASDQGRSVAADGTVPVAPAPGNGSRPIAGGYTGGVPASPPRAGSDAAIRAAQAGGWRDQATPTQMRQAPMMTQAENAFQLPAGYLGRVAQIESGGDPTKRNAGSGATGLFQFVPSTWKQYGDPRYSPLNAQASTVAAARLAADNSAQLSKILGRPPSAAELYLAHQQGAAGAAGLLANPNAPAASIVGAKAVISNGGTPNMTAGQFAGMWERKFNGQGGGNFSLSGPSPMGQGVGMPAAPAAALPTAGMGVGLRAAASEPAQPQRPDLAPPVTPGPIPLPSSTQPMPTAQPAAAEGRSASDALPPTRQLSQGGLVPIVPGMSLSQVAEQEAAGHRLGELPQTYATAAAAAKQQNVTLDQMANDAESFRMGRGADLEQDIHARVEGLSKYFGLSTPTIDREIGGYQAFVKASGQIARQAASGISPNVGVHELAMISHSLPNPEMSRNGFDQVKAILQGTNDFTIAKQQAADQYMAENHTLAGFENDWTRHADPSAFWVKRMGTDDLRTMAANMQRTPEGRVQLKRMMAGMQWLKERGLYE